VRMFNTDRRIMALYSVQTFASVCRFHATISIMQLDYEPIPPPRHTSPVLFLTAAIILAVALLLILGFAFLTAIAHKFGPTLVVAHKCRNDRWEAVEQRGDSIKIPPGRDQT